MKNTIIIFLIVSFLLLTCTGKNVNQNCDSITYFESGFSLCQDTIFVDIKGEMTHALKYRDKFYVLFEQRVLKYGGYGKRWLYIISNKKIEKTINCPNEMHAGYLDFYEKNDSIILKPYMDENSYYFDIQNCVWEKLEKTDDLIFEDDRFYVYSLDFGEWGGKTWFKDKKTNLEYLIEITTPLVNRIDTTYYLTNPFSILKIENPLQLNECNDDVVYENIEKREKYYSWHGQPIGYDIVYNDTTVDYFDYSYKSHIVSSFVCQNELFHIYETDSVIYIAKIKSDSIKMIQKIGEELSFYNWYYSYRCKNLNKKNELLKFQTQNERLFGLLDIVDNNISMLYIENNAELKPKSFGSEKSDSIFINRLNLILSEFGNLKLKNVDLAEEKWGTFDITPNHKIGIGDSWNPNGYIIDTCKSYLIQEDSLISNSIRYYATQTNDLIRAISFDWSATNFSRYDLNKLAREAFIEKLQTLKNILNQEVGQPIFVKKGKDKYPSVTWKTANGLAIQLSNEISEETNYNYIGLVIYKD